MKHKGVLNITNHTNLGTNLPQFRVTSRQSLCTEIVYTALEIFVPLLQTSSQKKSFLTIPHVENKGLSSYETLENTSEMKMTIKFYLCFHNFSEL